jgi:hypothetical protein
MEGKKYKYKSTYDDSVIEFVSRIPKGKTTKRSAIKEDLLVFRYIESKVKTENVEFKESDFKKYLSMGNFKRIC